MKESCRVGNNIVDMNIPDTDALEKALSSWKSSLDMTSTTSVLNTMIENASIERIPPSIDTLEGCAEHQIRSLLEKASSSSLPLSVDDEDALDDGFFICDLNVIQKKLYAWYQLFPRIKPFFALKCNPDPMVAAVLGQSQATGFDCASLPEIKLALSSTNGNTKACVYANPQRAEKDLDSSLALGVTALTFDGPEELFKVQRAYQKLLSNANSNDFNLKQQQQQQEQQRQKLQQQDPHKKTTTTATTTTDPPPPPNMILRLLVPDEHSSVPLGEKFGASPKAVESLARQAMELGLPIVGVSFHCGSGCHDAQAYGNAIKLAKEAMDVVNCVYNDYLSTRKNDLEEKKVLNDNQLIGFNEETEVDQDKDNISGPRQEKIENNENKEQKCCWLLDIGGGYPGWDGIGGDIGRFSGSTGTINKQIMTIPTNEKQTHVEGNEESHETAQNIARVVTPLLNELFPVETTHGNTHKNDNTHDNNNSKTITVARAEKTSTAVTNNHAVDIIAEPGRYFVEAAYALCSRIYRIRDERKVIEKETHISSRTNENNENDDQDEEVVLHRHYYVAQGVQGVFKDAILCDESFVPIPLSLTKVFSSNPQEQSFLPSTIHGPSGADDYDVICKDYPLPANLDVDDWLIFDRMGAYTLSIAARSGRPPIRYVVGG